MAEEAGAQEKTLEPSPRKLQKASEEGRFAQSRDLTFVLTLVLSVVFVTLAGTSFWQAVVRLVEQALRFDSEDPLQAAQRWVGDALVGFSWWMAGVLVLAAISGLLGALLLNSGRPVFKLRFDPSRLDPIAGIGRMFSVRNLFALGKGVLVTILLSGVAFTYLYASADHLLLAPTASLSAAMARMGALIGFGALWIVAAVAAIALIDTAFQLTTFRRELRMTYQEMRDEIKETEGSPEVRQRIRMLQRSAARRRMMSAVEKADVLVVNPTHYAVALRYRSDSMVAPLVVAVGVDQVALRMRAVATDALVPVAEFPALARWLVSHVEIGQSIPPVAYAVVARVLAWAYDTQSGPGSRVDMPAIEGGDFLESAG
jgi:flagellar biosynthesis protein FlhB